MKQTIAKFIRWFEKLVTNEEKRKVLQSKFIFSAFFVIAASMTFINIVTQRKQMMLVTFSFTILCGFNLILSMFSPRLTNFASYLFMFESEAMFLYFLVSGGVDNFSAIWLLLAPALSLFSLGTKKGLALSFSLFVFIILFFYIPPFTNYCTDYSETFKLRFPLVYASLLFVTLLIESIRRATEKKLNDLRSTYKYLYRHDELTGVYNRYGFIKVTEELKENPEISTVGIAIYDLDNFKKINDKYGHIAGDNILKELTDLVSDSLPQGATVCRFGGEEFIIAFSSGEKSLDDLEKILETVRTHDFTIDNETKIKLTISAGHILINDFKNEKKFIELIDAADKNLYEAKQSGKDRVVSTVYGN